MSPLNIPGLEAPEPILPGTWDHINDVLLKDEADKLYTSLVSSPLWIAHKDDWDKKTRKDGEAYAIHYGLSYTKGGGGREGEIAVIPPGWRNLADRIAKRINYPVNYIQLHEYGQETTVHPHTDPGGTAVPMLTVGQERSFRVGGTIDNEWTTAQRDRKLEWHHFEDEVLMTHGSLLLFRGSIKHSMVPASRDSRFNRNGCDWRISILFRWTTEAMRKYGPGKKATEAGQKEQYIAAVQEWREGVKNA